ncbi:hypothetical protein BG006_007020 [Podila minutissima]|uniref:Glutathione S-transferase n=1 Tax=Podila minutissima TaxID=64525 RepID=A0A9P5VKZ3_9FUNG|nr:hypothetical protein BG006_007020 [Podila minutissima]
MIIAMKLFELVDGKTRKNFFSPMVWRAKFALNHKNVPYESIALTFTEIPKKIPEACANVTAPTVPTLKLETGEGLQASLAIAEYLERTYPDHPSIFGEDPSEKNLQKFLESYMSSKLHPAFQRLVYIEMYEMQDEENGAYFKSSREKSDGGKTLQELGGDRAANLKEVKENLELIHTALKHSGGYVLGDKPGWADFVLISALIWLNSCAPQTFEEAVLNAIDD